MAYDGTLKFDTKIDAKGFEQGTKDINAEFKKAAGSFKTSVGAIVGALAVGAVGAIVKFETQAVKSASKVRAENSQMQQSFKSLKADAVEAFERIGRDTNILVGRLQPAGASIYAFAKTSGVDALSALELTERALVAAADSAAYYDQTLETTTERLKSFLKGNFENDAALGLSATEYTRNAKSMELYGKKFVELSEAQKQFTLLSMVEDANRMSGAMGQAAREGLSLENVLGNMKEAGRQFMAAFGEPLLNVVIPAMQWLTNLIVNLTAKMQYANSVMAKLFGWEEDQSGAIEDSADQQDKLTDSMKKTAKEQKKSLAGFDTIQKLVTKTAKTADQQAPLPGINVANQALQQKQVKIDVDINIPDGVAEKVENLKESFERIKTTTESLIQPISNVFSGFSVLKSPFSDVFVESIDVVSSAFELLGTVIGEYVSPVLKWLVDNIIVPLYKFQLSNILTVLRKINQILKSIIKFINGEIDFETLIDEITGTNNIINDLWNAIKNIYDFMTDKISFADLIRNLTDSDTWLAKILDKISGGKIDLDEFGEKAAETWENFKTDAKSAFGDLKDKAKVTWDELKETLSPVAEWMDENVFTPISETFSSIWTKIKTVAVNALNYVIDKLNSLLSGFADGLNGIIDLWNNTGGKILPKIQNVDAIQIPKIPLPQLAKGAVIPPNRRFIAELGDQTSGVNIEAPLKTITDAFEDVMRRTSGNRPMTVVLEVDKREFGRAVVQYGAQESNRIGVRIPV